MMMPGRSSNSPCKW